MALVKRGELHYGRELKKYIPPRCRVRIYELIGDHPDTEKTRVVVYSEPSRDPQKYQGLSVTNGAEHIATALWEQLDVHPDRTVYVEHYPDERPAVIRESPYASKSRLDGAESFDLVTFEWTNGKASRPNWKPVDREFVEVLIGEAFP
jgi:hypothetical protein